MATIPGPPGLSDAVQPTPFVTAFPAVDSFTIASFPMPGKWTLTDAKRKFGWQIQKGYALSGAQVFATGDELVVAKFRGEFWAMSDFNIFKQLRKQLFRKAVFVPPGGSTLIAAAMGIDHPELKALGVTNVVVLEVGAARQEEGGLWTITIDFLEYYPPRQAPPKPTIVIPDIASPTPIAQNAQQVESQKLAAEAAALRATP